MTKSGKYGVLLVSGLRTHQENYASFFLADQRCRLIAVTDEKEISPVRLELNKKFADELDLPYIEDLDEAIARDDVDIVSICAEHERRGRVAVKCAKAGKHLYLDKPMTCCIEDADAVVSAVKESGVKSQVFSFIHNPWVRLAKKVYESGDIGDLLAIHIDVLFAKGYIGTATLGKHRKQEPYPKRFTFIDSKRELRATGVYSVGILRWITNYEVKNVFGITENYFFAEHQHNDVEDFGMLALNMERDVTATIVGGRIGYTSHPSHGPMQVYLIGTKGMIKIDAYSPRLEIYNNDHPWEPPDINPDDPMGFWTSTYKDSKPKSIWVALNANKQFPNDASKFIDYIEAGRESEVSAIDGAAQVEILTAGYISAAKGEVIDLPLPRKSL
ncbi:MAG: Gfo/Idh/MocA family protein [bacterium]